MHTITTSSPAHLPSAAFGSGRFDAGLIYLIPFAAMVVTLTVLVAPRLLWPVLAADLWLLGYHHVIATYTRTSMDRDAFQHHWKLNLLLPPTVLAAVLLIGLAGGAIVLTTIYIHWQLYHYVRQSEGISKAFAARQVDRELPNRPALRVAFYLLPVAAFLTMASHSQGYFLNFPVWLPALPIPILIAIWTVTAIALVFALGEVRRSMRTRGISRQYLHYLISHLVVFGIAYALVDDVTISWLMANIWHNAQYLMFVWKANQQRFKGELHPRATLLSTLCRPGNLWMYITGCLAITFALYFGVGRAQGWIGNSFGLEPVLVAAVLYQAINFHHYIVDAIIWRRQKPPTPAVTLSRA